MTDTITVESWTHSLPPFPTTLSLTRTSLPSLGPNDLLLEIYSASLNPVDVQLSNLSIFRIPSLGSNPKGLGKDFVGKLLAKGSNVKRDDLQIGDVLFGVTMNPLGGPLSGTLSTISILDLSRTLVIKKPPSLSYSQAASLPLSFLTAKTCLSLPYFQLPSTSSSSRGSDTPGTIVVLGGTTSTGINLIQYAKLKLDEIIDYTKEESIVDRLKQIKDTLGEGGFVSIIDCIGGVNELLSTGIWKSLLLPRRGSYITIVGDKTDRQRLGGFFTNFWNLNQVWRSLKTWDWLGFRGGGPRYYCIDFDMTRKEWLEEVEEMVDERVGMKVIVDQEFEFEKVGEAFERLLQGKSTGKIVVKVKSSE
ncbi:hypothetical protein JCM5350_001955 [Sporobolomyces pararoseus]